MFAANGKDLAENKEGMTVSFYPSGSAHSHILQRPPMITYMAQYSINPQSILYHTVYFIHRHNSLVYFF
jgi:hypothetical protein